MIRIAESVHSFLCLDHCLEWMRLLCSSNGKLELKKNAATGYWGSVNRIASMFRHESFALPTAQVDTNDSLADTASLEQRESSYKRKMSRQDAARRFVVLLIDRFHLTSTFRRTSELILNRRLSRRF